MKRKDRRKLQSCQGMTLMETLAAITILALLASLMLVGIRSSTKVSRRSVFSSECQTVSDTIQTALSDVLRFATAVTVDSNGYVLAYSNPNYRISDGRICVGTGKSTVEDRGILYLKYIDAGDVGNRVLLGYASYSNLIVTPTDYNVTNGATILGPDYFDLKYDNSTCSFTGQYKLCDTVNKLISGTYTFTFRTVNSVTAQSG